MDSTRLWLTISFALGGLLVAALEIAALGGGSLSLTWVTMTLLLSIGLGIGLSLTGVEWVVARLGVVGFRAALVRSLVAGPALFWVCAHLFDGAMARTLPGAGWAHLWVPLVALLGLASGLWIAHRVGRWRAGRWAVLGTVTSMFAVIEYSNRTVLTREYQNVHAFLTLASVVCAGILVYGLCGKDFGRRGETPWGGALVGGRGLIVLFALVIVVAVDLGLVLGYGLGERSDRWLIATRGMHARQLVRVSREALDWDGDGYASALGGGDCDEGDPTVNPGAEDLPADGEDQDCDGADAQPPQAVDTLPEDDEAALKSWLSSPELAELAERTRHSNVVLVIVDALRADAFVSVSSDRMEPPTYPALAGLARESRFFSRAFSPAAGTDYSVAGLLTGRTDPFVGVDMTLIEAFAAMGYTTHAVLPREVLRWACQPLITRGLTSHDTLITDAGKRDVGDHSTSAETTDLGLAFLDEHLASRPGEPAFLWLHYFDVHEHSQMSDRDARLRQMTGTELLLDGAAKYRALVGIVDQEIGRLRQAMEERGIWDETIFILLSDHGESLGEDPRLPDTHGRYVYNALVHVPLLMRIPGVTPMVVERPVSLLDVAPTLLALMGREPLSGMDGASLLPWLLDGAPDSARARMTAIGLNESDQYGVVDWPYKLMLRPADNLLEVYDLAVDFAEKHDLSRDQPQLVQRLRAVLRNMPRVHVDRSLEARKRRDSVAGSGHRKSP